MWIVQLEPGLWLANGALDDPPRTMDRKWAGTWKTEAAAKAALTRARYYRPFPNAQIQPV